MKRIFYCALASAALFLSCTIQKPAQKPRFITVTASAAVMENADYALVTFPVSTAGWTAVKVIEDTRAAAGRISEALQAAGGGGGASRREPGGPPGPRHRIRGPERRRENHFFADTGG